MSGTALLIGRFSLFYDNKENVKNLKKIIKKKKIRKKYNFKIC